MDHFAGLDVSVKETSVCIVDDTGKIVSAMIAALPRTIRAPIFASATAATSPIPDVPPVMTTVSPLISDLVCADWRPTTTWRCRCETSIITEKMQPRMDPYHCRNGLLTTFKILLLLCQRPAR